MEPGSPWLFAILIVLVSLSAFFSASETALTSISKIKLLSMVEEKAKNADKIQKLTSNPAKMLSTILIGNNIVNICASSLATSIAIFYSPNAGVGIATVVMTVVVLIFGEITPKSLAKESPEKFAMFSAPIMQVFLWILTPVNVLFSLWKKLVGKIIRSDDTPSITEEELLTIVEEAEQDGGIDESESELIRSAIEFNDLQAVDIFTPRVDVEAVEIDEDKYAVAAVFNESGFSRLPVYDETIDNIVGIIHLKDFYTQIFTTDAPLSGIVKPAVFISRSMKIYDLLRLLQREKAHMAVIADEYGGTVGIVTMEDILEELVGEIWDEHDEVIEEIQKIEDDTYRIVCSAAIDDLEELFAIESDPDSDITTVSGWVMERLGRIPKEGDTFSSDGLFVTVTKTDARRVTEIVVKKESEF